MCQKNNAFEDLLSNATPPPQLKKSTLLAISTLHEDEKPIKKPAPEDTSLTQIQD